MTRVQLTHWLEACDTARRTTTEITHTLNDLTAIPVDPGAAKFLARASKARQTATTLRTAIDALTRELQTTHPTPQT